MLALKLAEADILFEKTGERPVVLLDDVMSELDMSRRDYLLNHLDGRQVFITCCDPETVRLMERGRGFLVERGVLKKLRKRLHSPAVRRAGFMIKLW